MMRGLNRHNLFCIFVLILGVLGPECGIHWRVHVTLPDSKGTCFVQRAHRRG